VVSYATLDIVSLVEVNGNPAVSYIKDSVLKYAEYNGSSWDIHTVDDSTVVYGYTSMVTNNGLLSIAYYDFTNGALKFASSYSIATSSSSMSESSSSSEDFSESSSTSSEDYSESSSSSEDNSESSSSSSFE